MTNDELLKLISDILTNPRTKKIYENPVIMPNGVTYDEKEMVAALKERDPIYPGSNEKNPLGAIYYKDINLREIIESFEILKKDKNLDAFRKAILGKFNCAIYLEPVFDLSIIPGGQAISQAAGLEIIKRKGNNPFTRKTFRIEDMRLALILRKLLMTLIINDKAFEKLLIGEYGKEPILKILIFCLLDSNSALYLEEPEAIIKKIIELPSESAKGYPAFINKIGGILLNEEVSPQFSDRRLIELIWHNYSRLSKKYKEIFLEKFQQELQGENRLAHLNILCSNFFELFKTMVEKKTIVLEPEDWFKKIPIQSHRKNNQANGYTNLFQLLLEKGQFKWCAQLFETNPNIISAQPIQDIPGLIHYAALSNNLSALELPESQDLLSQKDGMNRTPLHYAIMAGAKDAIQYILQKTRAANYQGTPNLVSLSIQTDNIETAKKLIQEGFDITSEDANGKTPLIYAIDGGYVELAYLLILKLEKTGQYKRWNHKNNSAIALAIEKNALPILKVLLTFMPPDYNNPQEVQNLMGFIGKKLTELNVLQKANHPNLDNKKQVLECFILYIRHFHIQYLKPPHFGYMLSSFELTSRIYSDSNPLFHAAMQEEIGVLPKFINCLCEATQDNPEKVVDLLKQHPHCWNAIIFREYLWFRNAKLSHEELILALIEKYKNDEDKSWFKPNLFGDTLLHWAAQRKNIEIIIALKKADFEMKPNDFNEYPLHLLAKECRDPEVLIALFENYGDVIDVNAKDIFGKTPLHYAKDPNIFALLLAYGAKISGDLLEPFQPSEDTLYKDLELLKRMSERQLATQEKFHTDIRNIPPAQMKATMRHYQAMWKKFAALTTDINRRSHSFFSSERVEKEREVGLARFFNEIDTNKLPIMNPTEITLSFAYFLSCTKRTFFDGLEIAEKQRHPNFNPTYGLAAEILAHYADDTTSKNNINPAGSNNRLAPR